jgi:hypothetical protein
MARLKKEKRVSLKREKEKSHKVTLNISIVANRGIMSGIIIRNRNRIKKLK